MKRVFRSGIKGLGDWLAVGLRTFLLVQGSQEGLFVMGEGSWGTWRREVGLREEEGLHWGSRGPSRDESLGIRITGEA